MEVLQEKSHKLHILHSSMPVNEGLLELSEYLWQIPVSGSRQFWHLDLVKLSTQFLFTLHVLPDMV